MVLLATLGQNSRGARDHRNRTWNRFKLSVPGFVFGSVLALVRVRAGGLNSLINIGSISSL